MIKKTQGYYTRLQGKSTAAPMLYKNTCTAEQTTDSLCKIFCRKRKEKWGCQHIGPFVFNEVGRSEDKRSLQLAGSKIN
jgi:hypothetical protein